MSTAEQILVIFLSVALATFLTLGIVLLVLCIKIANHVKRISAKAEELTDKAESVAEFFSKAATPMAVGRIIATAAERFFGRKSKKG
jgi:hypothetical protein